MMMKKIMMKKTNNVSNGIVNKVKSKFQKIIMNLLMDVV